MSLNKLVLVDSSRPVLQPAEKVSLESNVDLLYEAGTGYPGTASQLLEGKCRLFLTQIRLLLISIETKQTFVSIEIPLQMIEEHRATSTFFGFGTKTWEASIKVFQDSGLLAGHMTLVFTDGGSFEFNTYLKQLLLKLSDTIAVPYIEPLPMYNVEECPAPPPFAETPAK
jgi:hypothetical protein